MGAKAPICTRSLRSPLKARISELKLSISELKPRLLELKPSFLELKPRVSELKPKLSELKPNFSLQHNQDLTPKHNQKNDPRTIQKRPKTDPNIIKNRPKIDQKLLSGAALRAFWPQGAPRALFGSAWNAPGDPPGPSESRSWAQLRPNLSQLGGKLGSS